jgi:hypothetical protein
MFLAPHNPVDEVAPGLLPLGGGGTFLFVILLLVSFPPEIEKQTKFMKKKNHTTRPKRKNLTGKSRLGRS